MALLSTLRQRAVRPWTVLPLVAVLGGGTWFVSRSDADEGDGTTTVESTVDVTTGDIDQVVSASGTVEAADTDSLSFTAAGTVTAVNVAAGDQVTAGDVLATLDSPELEAAVTEAGSSVADAQAQLDDDEDAGASDAQIAADRSSLDSAQRQLDAAHEDLAGNQLVATIDGTVSTVDLTAGEELGSGGTSGTDMTGSDTGSGDSSSDLGDDSSGGLGGDDSDDSSGSSTAQIEVVSTGTYQVSLSIDPTEIDKVAEDQTVEIDVASSSGSTFPGGGEMPAGIMGGGGGQVPGGNAPSGTDTESEDGGSDDGEADDPAAFDPMAGAAEPDATGTVTSVGAIADASSGVAAFPVEVTFEGDAETFYVGSSVDVEIVYSRVEDAVQVPVMAVTTTDGRSTVVVETDDGQETRTIETGTSSGGYIEVTAGLDAGETVIITLTTGRPDSGGDEGDGGDDGGAPFTPPGGEMPAGGGGGPVMLPGGGGNG